MKGFQKRGNIRINIGLERGENCFHMCVRVCENVKGLAYGVAS